MAISFHIPNPPTGWPRLDLALLRNQANRLLVLTGTAANSASVVLVTDPVMAGYNEQYRGKNGPTNVLAFPGEAPAELAGGELGDIIISVDTASREAKQLNTSPQERILRLVIHGLLHLQGWDHERSDDEALRSWNREEELYKALLSPRRKTMPQLAINVDHVATVRQARGGAEPDPVTAAAICELAGASGIVVHLREDRRHIQDRDVRILRQTVKTKLNLEMAAAKEIIGIALDIQPDMVTLVPEKRQELTTEGGLDVAGNEKTLGKVIARMNKAGIPVSLFIDPDAVQIEAARELGATFVELHTGRYCDARDTEERERELRLIQRAAELAAASGLRVNAGHGLDYRNTPAIAALPEIEELSIGHAVISRAVFTGLDQAVREMLALCRPPAI